MRLSALSAVRVTSGFSMYRDFDSLGQCLGYVADLVETPTSDSLLADVSILDLSSEQRPFPVVANFAREIR